MMLLYQSKQWIADLDETIESIGSLYELEKKSIMITGAAGLVCSAIVDLLIRYNETHQNIIKIIAAGRWLEEMTNRFGSYMEKDYFSFSKYDASKNDNELKSRCDYIIHGASNASPDMIIKEPVETMLSNFSGIKYLLDYAKNGQTKRVLYISSSEVYGNKVNKSPYQENEYGFIDLLNPRNSYSIGKRAAETLCASYSDEYGMESVIVRPGHIYGPTASPMDARVSSAWAYEAVKGHDIVMKSDGAQIRSYCYCLDCASAILTVLLRGENKQAYNISNRNSIISIKQLGEMIAHAGNVRFIREMANAQEKAAFNPMINSSLNSDKLEQLGWKGLFDAERGIEHTLKVLKDTIQ